MKRGRGLLGCKVRTARSLGSRLLEGAPPAGAAVGWLFRTSPASTTAHAPTARRSTVMRARPRAKARRRAKTECDRLMNSPRPMTKHSRPTIGSAVDRLGYPARSMHRMQRFTAPHAPTTRVSTSIDGCHRAIDSVPDAGDGRHSASVALRDHQQRTIGPPPLNVRHPSLDLRPLSMEVRSASVGALDYRR